MFTGLIEEVAEVLSCTKQGLSTRLILSNPFKALAVGESIAVNGVCLTLLPGLPDTLCFDVSPETVAVTTLAALLPGESVNLERAMSASSRFGGHYVSGHVDTQAQVLRLTELENCVELVIGGFSNDALRYLLSKGSITVEGVSLTINTVSKNQVSLMLIPHTLERTTLQFLNAGQFVNIEFDYLTRIIAHQLQCMTTVKDEVLL